MNVVRKTISNISEMLPLNDLDDDTANSLLNSLEELRDMVSLADSLDDVTKEDFVLELKEIHDYILYDLVSELKQIYDCNLHKAK